MRVGGKIESEEEKKREEKKIIGNEKRNIKKRWRKCEEMEDEDEIMIEMLDLEENEIRERMEKRNKRKELIENIGWEIEIIEEVKIGKKVLKIDELGDVKVDGKFKREVGKGIGDEKMRIKRRKEKEIGKGRMSNEGEEMKKGGEKRKRIVWIWNWKR